MEDRRVGVGQARDLSTLAPPRHQLEGSSRFHLSPVHLESSLANSIHARANCKSPLDDSSRHGPGLSQTPEPAPSPHRSPDDQHAGPAARLALLNLDVSSFSRRPRSPCVQRSTVYGLRLPFLRRRALPPSGARAQLPFLLSVDLPLSLFARR
jgi:hypothetical protein